MILKNVYDNEMKLEFASKSSNEAFARIAVAAFAAQLDPTIEELADIKTAVRKIWNWIYYNGKLYGRDESRVYFRNRNKSNNEKNVRSTKE